MLVFDNDFAKTVNDKCNRSVPKVTYKYNNCKRRSHKIQVVL